MDVACQVQVEILHGDDLRVNRRLPAAALDAEGRSLRRLADDRDERAQMRAECLAQTDRGRSLAFAERGGGDGGAHVDVLAVRRASRAG